MYLYLLLLGYSIYIDIEALTFFVFLLITEALLCCRVVVVAKQKDCHVPSSAKNGHTQTDAQV